MCYDYPSIDMQRTGANIESLRKEKGISVKALQEYFGFEYPQAIYNWQHGECLPSIDNLFALSRIFNVSMEDILVEDEMSSSDFYMTLLIAKIKSNRESARLLFLKER